MRRFSLASMGGNVPVALAAAGITAIDRGAGSHGTSVSTVNVASALTGTMAAGSTGILILSFDNANLATINLTVGASGSYTDSKGNVWYVKQVGLGGAVANSTMEGELLVSDLTASLTSSDTLNITLTVAATAKTWSFVEAYSGLTDGSVIYVTSVITGFSASTAPTSSTSASSDPAVGNLFVGICAVEFDDVATPVSGGTSGTWSAGQHTGVGTGATGSSIMTQNKIFTAKVIGTYNPTLSSSADGKIGWGIFAECDVRARMTAGANASEATSTWTIQRPLAIGSLAVLCLAGDNNGTSGTTTNFPTGLTDPKGNTWTRQQTGIRNVTGVGSGVELGIYTSVLTVALVEGDTLAATYLLASVTAKAALLLEIAPTHAGTMSYVTGGLGPGTTSATPSYVTGSITNGDYVIGVTGAEAMDNMTGDTDTTNGAWGPQTTVTRGSTLANSATVAAQIKKVTATATQTYDVVSGDGSVDVIQGWIQVHES